jgi:hypothetical protein
MSFCTAVNCMDGRVQTPVAEFAKDRFGVTYVDTVTEAGPVRALAAAGDPATAASIERRVAISVEDHGSAGVVVVAHAECAGNPVDDDTQLRQLGEACARLADTFPGLPVLGLWVDETRRVRVTEEHGGG